MIYFTAHTFKCVCHCRRAMFGVLGMYNFDFRSKILGLRPRIFSNWYYLERQLPIMHYSFCLSASNFDCPSWSCFRLSNSNPESLLKQIFFDVAPNPKRTTKYWGYASRFYQGISLCVTDEKSCGAVGKHCGRFGMILSKNYETYLPINASSFNRSKTNLSSSKS